MTKFAVIDAKPWHVGQMIRRMRGRHREEMIALGLDTHRELRATFNASAVRRAWLIDGDIAAIGGVAGTLADSIAFVWLVISEDATRYPLAFVRAARTELDAVMASRVELFTTVLPGDLDALRFAAFMGFHIAHPEDPLKPDDVASDRHGREALVKLCLEDGAHRIGIIGRAQTVIGMGYHREAGERSCA